MDLIPVDSPDTTEEIFIFNPTKEDFTHSWLSVPYTIKSYEGAKFPKDIADHLAKHLKDRIVGEMNEVITDTVVERVLKSIYMN